MDPSRRTTRRCLRPGCSCPRSPCHIQALCPRSHKHLRECTDRFQCRCTPVHHSCKPWGRCNPPPASSRRCHLRHRRPRVTATHAQHVQLIAITVAIAFWDVEASALVNRTRSEAHVAFVFKSAFFFRVADAVVVQFGQSPPHTPMASSWLPLQSQSPRECQHIHNQRSRRGRCERRMRLHPHSRPHRRKCHRHQRPTHTIAATRADGVRLVPLQSQSPSRNVKATAFVAAPGPLQTRKPPHQCSHPRRRKRHLHLRLPHNRHHKPQSHPSQSSRNLLQECQSIRTPIAPGPLHTPQASTIPMQSSTSSQMPSPSSGQSSRRHPHTRRPQSRCTSSDPNQRRWFPSQSQSPSGMSEHPHS